MRKPLVSDAHSTIKPCLTADPYDAGMEHIGELIATLLDLRGIRKTDVAARIGVTRSAVTNWCSTGKIRKDHLMGVARMLGTTSDALQDLEFASIEEVQAFASSLGDDRRPAAPAVELARPNPASSPIAAELGRLVASAYDRIGDDAAKASLLSQVILLCHPIPSTVAPDPAGPPSAATTRKPNKHR